MNTLIKTTSNKVKLCGIPVLRIKDGRIFFWGIPVGQTNPQVHKIVTGVAQNCDFDMGCFDREISELFPDYKAPNTTLKPQKIAYIASILYDTGGHTKCIRDLVQSLLPLYSQKVFLTKLRTTQRGAPHITTFLKNNISLDGIEHSTKTIGVFPVFRYQVKKMADAIIRYAPSTLLVYIHPDDILGTAVIAMIRKTTNMRIIFVNHASHYPNLGMTFADVIMEGMQTTVDVTQKLRHLSNTFIIGLQSISKDATIYYSGKELSAIKVQLGIPADALITMSGGAGYKFFNKDNSSDYFEMIKRILRKETDLYHVLMSDMPPELMDIVEKIFLDAPDERKRLILKKAEVEYDKYFQCADVFIDSFPVSGALTQVDLMRNKVASVVKINREVPHFSFHEYQMIDYPYMFDKLEDFELAVHELLHDKEKRQNIIQKNYDFWLKTYESSVVRDKFIQVIKG